MTPPYATPAAFRRALTDKLKAIAAPHSPWTLADLQRQFAYDRLLVRLYLFDDHWILKGSTALLARGISVRHTVDIDVYRTASRDQAETDLRAALELDAGDCFTFTAGAGQVIADGAKGVRVHVDAYLGATLWAGFHVDIVAEGVQMTGTPECVPALTAVDIPGLVRQGYLAYPLIDHIADKTCAMLERPAERPSTRFKDLVDLVVLVGNVNTTAGDQLKALTSESERRRLVLPDRFDVPDTALWTSGYEAEVKKARIMAVPRLDAALAVVGPFLDPLLDGSAVGAWDPQVARWV